jgi:hypothetical protein
VSRDEAEAAAEAYLTSNDEVLLNLLALGQFFWLLFAREPNPFVARFGNSLSIWLAEVGQFLTCATDDKPFPWKPWPDTGGSAAMRP